MRGAHPLGAAPLLFEKQLFEKNKSPEKKCREKNKIKKIETKGKKFDPNLHQAMTEIEDEKSDAGIILQEVQAGYMFGERLLRPALVGVSKKKN